MDKWVETDHWNRETRDNHPKPLYLLGEGVGVGFGGTNTKVHVCVCLGFENGPILKDNFSFKILFISFCYSKLSSELPPFFLIKYNNIQYQLLNTSGGQTHSLPDTDIPKMNGSFA